MTARATSAPATVTIDVTPANDVLPNTSVRHHGRGHAVAIPAGSDHRPGSPSPPQNGTLSDAESTGSDSFTFAADGSAVSNIATVANGVTLNDRPVAESVTTAEDTPTASCRQRRGWR